MFGAIAGGIASALAGGAMSKLFGGGQKAASGGIFCSSRGRHTRCLSDWSSDVCSSDLVPYVNRPKMRSLSEKRWSMRIEVGRASCREREYMSVAAEARKNKYGAIAGGIASAVAGGDMSKLFGGGHKAADGDMQDAVLAT